MDCHPLMSYCRTAKLGGSLRVWQGIILGTSNAIGRRPVVRQQRCNRSGSFGAGNILQLPSSFNYAASELQQVFQQEWTPYVYGTVTYQDPFGNIRETRWALGYQFDTAQFAFLPLYNSAT